MMVFLKLSIFYSFLFVFLVHASESPPSNSALMQDLEFGDIDDHDASLRQLELKPASQTIQKPTMLKKIPSAPIDLKTAIVSWKNI